MGGAGAVLRAARVRFKPRAAAVFGAGYTLSKIALQDIVMSQEYPAHEVEAALTNLFQLSPIPDYSLNFDIPISELRERLVKRDGIFRHEHEQIIEPTKRKINHYAEVFRLAKIDLHNDKDIEQAIRFIKQITEPFL